MLRLRAAVDEGAAVITTTVTFVALLFNVDSYTSNDSDTVFHASYLPGGSQLTA
jgi:hypothetical protein